MKLEFAAGALRPIGREQLEQVGKLAGESPRRRAITRYHEHDEVVQRMLNAVEPDSYVRPHKHEEPDKVEVFIALEGRTVLCTFEDDGALRDVVELAPDGPVRGVEIPPRTWHSLFTLDRGTLLYEILDGPYVATTHKSFASWAPDENAPEAEAWLADLRRRAGYA